MLWLHYSYWQLGKKKNATQILREMEKQFQIKPSPNALYHLAFMRRIQLEHDHSWIDSFEVDNTQLSHLGRYPELLYRYAKALKAVVSSSVLKAEESIKQIQERFAEEVKVNSEKQISSSVDSCHNPDPNWNEYKVASEAIILGLEAKVAYLKGDYSLAKQKKKNGLAIESFMAGAPPLFD